MTSTRRITQSLVADCYHYNSGPSALLQYQLYPGVQYFWEDMQAICAEGDMGNCNGTTGCNRVPGTHEIIMFDSQKVLDNVV